MRLSSLRLILLVKAIEEADTDGAILAPADRLEATRAARAPAPRADDPHIQESPRLAGKAQRFLIRRARSLFDRLLVRHPALAVMERMGGGPAWAYAGVVLAALLAGLTLATVDGTRRINILAYPLIGLVAWNLLVYALIAAMWLRGLGRADGSSRGAGVQAIGAALGSAAARLLRRLGTPRQVWGRAAGQFAVEWRPVAARWTAAHASRLLHLGSAAIAVGLIAGLYAKGITFRFLAGWESTFLDARAVEVALRIVLSPASWITGIALPDAAALARIEFRGSDGGEGAAPWIHLFAATAAIFILLPRLALAALSTANLWRLSLTAAVPVSLVAYYQSLVGSEAEGVSIDAIRVLPYGQRMSAGSDRNLAAMLARAFGARARVEAAEPVQYGEEERSARDLDGRRGTLAAIVFNLATTPEAETHGHLIDIATKGAAGRRGPGWLLMAIDESAWRARYGDDPGYASRRDERRAAWQAFIGERGLPCAFVDIDDGSDGERLGTAARALAAALWAPGP